tara:strand:+ start:1697 stop:2401 length:705 start_codon:yes stop_codon:yes gene_type:complete
MTEEFNLETYLKISSSEFGIYLFDLNNSNILYKKVVKVENNTDLIDLIKLNDFLKDNIFKIEKLTRNFVKNILLVIENNEIGTINLSFKKKNYQKIIFKKNLEIVLTEAKELFIESYRNEKIIHMILNKFAVNENLYSSFKENLSGENFFIEVQFKYISNSFIAEIDKVLEKYQIKVSHYLDENYINFFFKGVDLEFPEMIYKISRGFNQNEIKFIQKNPKKLAFFERFFNLFS